MRRPLLVAVAVAAALLLGAGAAAAAWAITGPGTATAAGGTLAAPADVTAGTPACSGTTGSVRFTWTAPAGAVSYQLELASNSTFTQGQQSGSTTNAYATATVPGATNARTVYFRTRAVAGNWVSPTSAVVPATVGPCR